MSERRIVQERIVSNNKVQASIFLNLIQLFFSCYPIILNGRMDYIDDDETTESGEFRQGSLRETHEFIYNAIGAFKQHDLMLAFVQFSHAI